MTIDCSSAMIAPGDGLVVARRQAPESRLVLVEGVERVGGERQDDAEQADEELRREHVDDRAHAAEAHARADRREQVPPVQEPGGHEA